MPVPPLPEVSIITANYNCEKFISQTIESVLNQTFSDWEMIIVDDNSTDNSVALIERYCDRDPRIQLIKLDANVGPAKARNAAIEKASGRFIAFLDSDDLWTQDKLEIQIVAMKINNWDLTYTEYKKIDEEGTVISETIPRPSKVDYKKMLNSNYIPCLTAIYDTERLGKVYMPNILKRQDYGLWLDILKVIDYAHVIERPLAYYRVRKSKSVSSNKIMSALYHWKILRDHEHVPIHRAIRYFINYAFLGYLKFKK